MTVLPRLLILLLLIHHTASSVSQASPSPVVSTVDSTEEVEREGVMRRGGVKGLQHNTSLISHTYCALLPPAHPLSFDCLNTSSANSASVKRLLSPASSAAACSAACAAYTYRGLPCRQWTFFSPAFPLEAFRSACYGRIAEDSTSNINGTPPTTATTAATTTTATATATTPTPTPGATSGSLGLPDCSSDDECELNGRCTGHVCVCHPGWGGRFCETLGLAPTPRDAGYRRANTSSWGGSVAFDARRKKWVMLTAEIGEHCGLNLWYLLSRVILAVSDTGPAGPYAFDSVVVERLGHQPTLATNADKSQWLLFHQGAGGNCSNVPNKTHCVNGSTPGAKPDFGSHTFSSRRTGSASSPQVEEEGLGEEGVGEEGVEQVGPEGEGVEKEGAEENGLEREGLDCMATMVRSATHPSGPWSAPVEAEGLPDNPTAVVLRNGTVLLLGRGFGSSNVTGFVSTINLQRSLTGWRGPYTSDTSDTADTTDTTSDNAGGSGDGGEGGNVGGGGGERGGTGEGDGNLFPDLPAPGREDGFVWQRDDGTFHAIFHGMTRQNLTWACKGQPSSLFPGALKVLPCPEPRFHPSPWVGRHAWSRDGRTWAYSPRPAFGSTVRFTDGTSASYARRERPHLVLDDHGNPTHLVRCDSEGVWCVFGVFMRERVREREREKRERQFVCCVC